MQIKIFNSRQLNETKELNLCLTTDNLKQECFIGRSPSASLVLNSADVSRLHGKIFQQSGDFYFIDIGSRNGSIINGKLAEINQKYLLKPGDIIRIGEFVLILEEVDVIRQDLAETVFSSTNAIPISDRPTHIEVFESVAAAEIPISDRPTDIELDEVDPILELDPWQELESEFY